MTPRAGCRASVGAAQGGGVRRDGQRHPRLLAARAAEQRGDRPAGAPNGQAAVRARQPCCLTPNAAFALQITEKDAEVLQHLTDIDCSESENSFKLVFHFDKNDHFDHDTLVRLLGGTAGRQRLPSAVCPQNVICRAEQGVHHGAWGQRDAAGRRGHQDPVEAGQGPHSQGVPCSGLPAVQPLAASAASIAACACSQTSTRGAGLTLLLGCS